MSFAAHSLALARGASLCGLALLLLLTPICGALCHTQWCLAPAHSSGTSPCHESANAGRNDSADGRIDSLRICSLRELPATLPADSRAQSLLAERFVKSVAGAESWAAPVFLNLLVSWVPFDSSSFATGPSRVRTDAGSPLTLRI